MGRVLQKHRQDERGRSGGGADEAEGIGWALFYLIAVFDWFRECLTHIFQAEAEAAGRASANIVASNYGAAGGASYQPQPYQQQHYPNYNPYPGYPAHQPHPAPPDQQQ